ncbi:MAG: hypothetical protein ACREGJ_04495 [Candidatus Saccharimonadales bacterium]
MLKPPARDELAKPLKASVEAAQELAARLRDQEQEKAQGEPDADWGRRRGATYTKIAKTWVDFTELEATCDFMREQSPVSTIDRKRVKRLARRALAPMQLLSTRAARSNKRANQHVAYYNQDTYYDRICRQVAGQAPEVGRVALRLMLDQLEIGYPNAAFFRDGLKLKHKEDGGLIQSPFNGRLPHPYAHAIESAAMTATYHRYSNMRGFIGLDHSHDPLVGVVLSVEHALAAIDPDKIKEDAVQQYRLRHLMMVRTPQGVPAAQLNAVLPPQWRAKADHLILEYGHLVQRPDTIPLQMAKRAVTSSLKFAKEQTNPYVDRLAERFNKRRQDDAPLTPPKDDDSLSKGEA